VPKGPGDLIPSGDTVNAMITPAALYYQTGNNQTATFIHSNGGLFESTGNGDKLTLIDDTDTGVYAGQNTQLNIGDFTNTITVQGFNSSDHINFTDVGYQSVQQALASVKSDGHGGIMFTLGGGSTKLVDLVDVTSISAHQLTVTR
jgi:hypothetical protein